MNRLATQPPSPSQQLPSPHYPVSLPLDPLPSFGTELAGDARPACKPAVFCPLHYESGYAYPLIVWLHENGQSEHGLRQVIPRISLRNYVAVGPRGTAGERNAHGGPGFKWSQSAEQVELADERVWDAINFVRDKLNVASERTFIAGRGAGGTMALRLAFEYPDRFAGAISLGGLLPCTGQPLRRVNELRDLPLLLSVSVSQSSCPSDELCQNLRLLHSAGMSVSLRQYQGCDSVFPLMLTDMDRWIMDIICPADDAAACD